MCGGHVQETAGGERLSFQLFELPRTDREAIGTFLGLARAERAARKRSRARARGETTDREATGLFSRARARDFFFRFQLFCGFLDVAEPSAGSNSSPRSLAFVSWVWKVFET